MVTPRSPTATQGDDMTTYVSEHAAAAMQENIIRLVGASFTSLLPPYSPTPKEKMYLLAFATAIAVICIPFSLYHISATMSALSRRLMMKSRAKLICIFFLFPSLLI